MNYKRKANMTLLITAILFIVCAVFRYFYRDIFMFKLILFVLEASLVGGIADWFAVTALFTKPLGFSYHTAIIPNNRKSIINATANMVEKELLSKDTIKAELDKLNIAESLIYWIEKEDKEYYINKVLSIVKDYIAKRDVSKVAESIEALIKKQGQGINLSEVLKDFITKKFEVEEKEVWVDKALESLNNEGTKERLERQIRAMLEDDSSEGTANFAKNLLQKLNMVNPEDLSGIIIGQITKLLMELKNPEGTLSKDIEENLLETVVGINSSSASLEEWKNDLLNTISFKEVIAKQLSSLLKQLTIIEYAKNDGDGYKFAAMTESEEASKQLLPVLQWLNHQVSEVWEYIKNSDSIKTYIDNFIKDSIFKVLELKHNTIGNIAAEALNDFTDEELNEFIESKAGEDLQWIRINGSVLGASLGFVVFMFLNFVYDPFIGFLMGMFSNR